MHNKFKKVFILVNDPLYVYQHLLPIIEILKNKFKIYIICAYKKDFQINLKDIIVINVPILRDPSFIDFFAFIKFSIIRIKYRPKICISFTAKAGLVNALTSIMSGKSIHYFTGPRWVNLTGLRRWILKLIDRFIIFSCLKIYCDSKSQAKLISEQLNVDGIKFFGKGSISGVNINKFNIQNEYALKRLEELGLFKLSNLFRESNKKKLKIICFIGRVNEDKGIRELLEGFSLHNKKFKDSFLLIIGPNELNSIDFMKVKALKNCLYMDFLKDVNLIFPFAYCLVLPSYREGFGSIVIEAAASRTPIIATNIPGPKDFITHLKNGYLIRPKNPGDIRKALKFFRENPKIINKFSENAFNKCYKNFAEEYVCNLFVKELEKNI